MNDELYIPLLNKPLIDFFCSVFETLNDTGVFKIEGLTSKSDEDAILAYFYYEEEIEIDSIVFNDDHSKYDIYYHPSHNDDRSLFDLLTPFIPEQNQDLFLSLAVDEEKYRGGAERFKYDYADEGTERFLAWFLTDNPNLLDNTDSERKETISRWFNDQSIYDKFLTPHEAAYLKCSLLDYNGLSPDERAKHIWHIIKQKTKPIGEQHSIFTKPAKVSKKEQSYEKYVYHRTWHPASSTRHWWH